MHRRLGVPESGVAGIQEEQSAKGVRRALDHPAIRQELESFRKAFEY